MSQNRGEILAGAVVVAIALGFFVYGASSTGTGMSRSGNYEITASFRSVEGITVGTDVRLAGVKIGTVSGLDLNAETFRADARLAIDSDILLPDDSSILVSSEGLLGGNFIEVQPGGSPFNIEPGGEVVDTQGAVSLISLLMKFVGSE